MANPTVLTIAGSDSGGGAGIQADIKTMQALGCYATSVVTALTAQNTLGVQGVHEVPAEFVIKQLDSLLVDLPPAAIKTGMLASSPIIQAIAKSLSKIPSASLPHLVVDPVTISTSNHVLLPQAAIADLCSLVLPWATLITPNIMEAELIVNTLDNGAVVRVTDLFQAWKCAVKLRGSLHSARSGNAPISLLVKGGHLPMTFSEVRDGLQRIAEDASTLAAQVEEDWASGAAEDTHDEFIEVLAVSRKRHLAETAKADVNGKFVVDLLLTQDKSDGLVVVAFVSRAIVSMSTHGTGCTLSAAIASSLALENDMRTAVRNGIRFTQLGISTADPSKGKGHGPLNHSCLTSQRALPLPTSNEPHPFISHLVRSSMSDWKKYVRHPFVVQLGKGTLPRKCFQHYIVQDYLYLRHYARAHALAAFKSSDFADIQAMSEIALHVAKESNMHVQFCESFGITFAELQIAPESAPTSAYARYILDIGQQGDLVELLVAVLSCLIGYGEVGLWLAKQVSLGTAVLEGNPYKKWMEDYSGQEFQDAVHRGIESLERRMVRDPPSPVRLARLTTIWQECTRLESAFWTMGMELM